MKQKINKKEEKRKLLKQLKSANRKLEKQKYEEWVKKVKERDNYTCQICKKYLKDGNVHNIQAHHILAKTTYPELKFDINNGITLCYYDHKNSKVSPHLNGFAFTHYLMKNKVKQYKYLLKFLNTKVLLLNSNTQKT